MLNLDRLEILIGNDNLNIIKEKCVAIIGLGGVGSYAVEGLVRSGISNFVIADYDIIDETNLNRQLMALQNNVGIKKTDVYFRRICDINPKCNVIRIENKLTKDNLDCIFKYDIDYVIDACDTIEVKKELIRLCSLKNIKLLSVMGMGNKMNPEKIKISDLSKTSYDPIAKILRNYLKSSKIKNKIKVVFSDEIPVKNNNKIIGSNSFVPSIAGLMCVSYVINDICKR